MFLVLSVLAETSDIFVPFADGHLLYMVRALTFCALG